MEAAEDFLSKLFAKDEDFSNRVIPHALVVAVALQHRARHLFLDGDDDAAVNNMPSRVNILLL